MPSITCDSPSKSGSGGSPVCSTTPLLDVLVIGAGMAGLSAAHKLSELGFSVVVLEGRDRIGGRLFTDRSIDPRLGVDLGGAWIHGTGVEGEQNPIYSLAQKYDLPLHPTNYEDSTVFLPDCVRMDRSELTEHGCLYARFEQYLRHLTACDPMATTENGCALTNVAAVRLAATIPPPPVSPHHAADLALRCEIGDATLAPSYPAKPSLFSEPPALAAACFGCQLSVQAVVDLFVAHSQLNATQAARLAFEVHSNVEHYWAGDAVDTAAGIFAEQMYGGDDMLFPKGYDQLTSALAEGLDIRLCHVVAGIDYMDPKRVRVLTNHGIMTARFVVVTLPLGVLKSGNVCFKPPLLASDPVKEAAIARLGTAIYNKAVLLFDEPFWDTTDVLLRVPSGDCDRGQWSVFLNLHKATGVPILVGFNLGAYARSLESLSDEATTAAALRALRRMYGSTAVPDPIHAVITRWGSDPFSLMSYSYLPVGATTADFDSVYAPIAGAVFFAGEACSSAHFGTVHGAHTTGIAAARGVAFAARRESQAVTLLQEAVQAVGAAA